MQRAPNVFERHKHFLNSTVSHRALLASSSHLREKAVNEVLARRLLSMSGASRLIRPKRQTSK